MTILTIILLLLGFIINSYRANKVKNYFEINENLKLKKINNNFKVNIIIPVLDEQKIIEDKLYYFSKLIRNNKNLCIYIVSTIKDRNTPSTKTLIDSYIKKYGVSPRLKHLHYKKEGIMAHQLNYAINNITNKNDVIGIYNIDSEINDKTIDFVSSFYSSTHNQKDVLQQVCIFEKKEDRSSIINSAISWQNRWSLTFELARYISLNRQHKNNFLFKDFQYVIGHGLFFTKNIIEQLGGFSQNDLNEDNQLGFKLMINQIDINPIPFLEKGDFTNNVFTYIKQQSVWFNGPLYSFKYYNDLKPYRQKVSKRAKYYSIKNFIHALNWIGLPNLFLLSIIKSSIQKNLKHVLLLLLSLYLYVTYINKICNRILEKALGDHQVTKGRNSYFKDIQFFLIHSIGPLKTLIKILVKQNTQNNKYRTPKE